MKIHRFKCSELLNQEIMNFAEIHKFDTDEILVEQWKDWMENETIKSLVEQESIFLERHSYEIPIETKIFKSIKYYYIKKFLKSQSQTKSKSNEKEKPKENLKKEIHKLSPEIIKSIKDDLRHQFETNPEFKPAETYEKFKTVDDPLIKKSYKNQYYQMKNKKYI